MDARLGKLSAQNFMFDGIEGTLYAADGPGCLFPDREQEVPTISNAFHGIAIENDLDREKVVGIDPKGDLLGIGSRRRKFGFRQRLQSDRIVGINCPGLIVNQMGLEAVENARRDMALQKPTIGRKDRLVCRRGLHASQQRGQEKKNKDPGTPCSAHSLVLDPYGRPVIRRSQKNLMNPLALCIDEAARQQPEKVAFIDRTTATRRTASYAELHRTIRRSALRLRENGLRPGQRVLLAADNHLDFPAAWFGVAYAGGTIVPAPILSSIRDLVFRLRHAQCDLAIVDREREAVLREAVQVAGRSIKLVRIDELTRPGDEAEPTSVAPGSLGMILYTSGTTGQPKGAGIAQETLLGHTRVIATEGLALGADDSILGALPFTHSFGCRTAMLTTVLCGAQCVLTPRFDAAQSLQIAIEERVSFIPAVPTMFARWGVLPAGPRPERLHTCLAAGSPIADEIVLRAEDRLGAPVRQAYGMTEATLATIDSSPQQRVLGSVGRAASDSEIRVLDKDGGALTAGERGEICIRGGGLMSGYIDDPDGTAQVLRDGWMHTGDIGWVDTDGRLFVVDRIKDMIIRGGNNIYPAEVESVLVEFPGVASAAVVGREHPVHGEEIVAIIEPVAEGILDLAALQQHARDSLARNRLPREWAVVKNLPLGPSRKILKRELREEIHSGSLATTAMPGSGAPNRRPGKQAPADDKK